LPALDRESGAVPDLILHFGHQGFLKRSRALSA
jgi:hypothetical protein